MMELSKRKSPRVKKMKGKDSLDFIKAMNFVNLASPIGTNGEKFLLHGCRFMNLSLKRSFWL